MIRALSLAWNTKRLIDAYSKGVNVRRVKIKRWGVFSQARGLQMINTRLWILEEAINAVIKLRIFDRAIKDKWERKVRY